MNDKPKYTIRRHLKKDANFGQFIVRGYKSDSKQGAFICFVDPEKFNLNLLNCRVYTSKATVRKIFEGLQYKEACAWIICDDYKIKPSKEIKGQALTFDPRKNVDFLLDGQPVERKQVIKEIETYKTNLLSI